MSFTQWINYTNVVKQLLKIPNGNLSFTKLINSTLPQLLNHAIINLTKNKSMSKTIM